MKASTLKSLGATRLSQQFRNLTARVISAAEIRADHGGTSPEVVAFFQDALARTPGTPALGANVLDGSNVNVKNSVGALSHVAVAAVSGTTLTDVKLAATATIVDNAAAAVIQNSAGTAVPGTHPRTVALGVESNIKLAATVGVVVNAVKQSGWTVTGSGTFFTPTVVAGVCTGGVLSAS